MFPFFDHRICKRPAFNVLADHSNGDFLTEFAFFEDNLFFPFEARQIRFPGSFKLYNRPAPAVERNAAFPGTIQTGNLHTFIRRNGAPMNDQNQDIRLDGAALLQSAESAVLTSPDAAVRQRQVASSRPAIWRSRAAGIRCPLLPPRHFDQYYIHDLHTAFQHAPLMARDARITCTVARTKRRSLRRTSGADVVGCCGSEGAVCPSRVGPISNEHSRVGLGLVCWIDVLRIHDGHIGATGFLAREGGTYALPRRNSRRPLI